MGSNQSGLVSSLIVLLSQQFVLKPYKINAWYHL